MPRAKATAPAADALPAATESALVADAARHGELLTKHQAELQQLDAQLGLTAGYDRDKFIIAARDCAYVMSQRAFLLGRICIALKAHEPHGGFESALEEIGLTARAARRYMQAARVFLLNSDPRSKLPERLGESKLLELLSESEADLDALADGGTLAGHTVDEFAGMSVRELKDKLREARKLREEDAAAHEELAAKREKRIRDLELKARGLKRKPANERALELLTELDIAVAAMLRAGDEAKAIVASVKEVYAEAGEEIDEAIESRLRHAAESATALGEGVERLIND